MLTPMKLFKLRTILNICRSAHIPAIVVSQPSIETEDGESEANDTERYNVIMYRTV